MIKPAIRTISTTVTELLVFMAPEVTLVEVEVLLVPVVEAEELEALEEVEEIVVLDLMEVMKVGAVVVVEEELVEEIVELLIA